MQSDKAETAADAFFTKGIVIPPQSPRDAFVAGYAAALSDQERAVEVKALETARVQGAIDGLIETDTFLAHRGERLVGTSLSGVRDAVRSALAVLRSALVDVPVEPVAWMHTLHMDGGETAVRLARAKVDQPWGKPGMDFDASFVVTVTPLYTSPHLPHRGEDSAEVIEEGAKILAKWIGYAWDGLGERDISADYRDWSYNGIGALSMQGGKPALRKVASSILARAATRSGSATDAKGGDHG